MNDPQPEGHMASYIARRNFLATLGGAAAAWPLAARAQQAERMRRIGVLDTLTPDNPIGQARNAAFIRGLLQLGWTDGRNIQINTRWAAGDDERLRKYAAELVALAPDAILGHWQPCRRAVATSDPHRAYRVCECRRPGRRRLC